MVEIFSKQDGPRREDAQVKRLIEQNRGVITKLADQFSGGRYSASKRPLAAPQAEGLIIHIGGGPATPPEPEPKIRVAPNGRVIVVDVSAGRQLQHFGDIRDRGKVKVFTMATKVSGYIAPVDEATAIALEDLDGVVIGDGYTASDLAIDIGLRLNIPPEA